MYGAILGDIVSFKYELDNSEIFYLTDMKFKFTDQTVTTIAIADALLSIKNDDDETKIKSSIKKSLKTWYDKYFGNYKGYDPNAAFAISAIPYIYNDPEQIVKITEYAASSISNNSNVINSAVIAALAIYYAKVCPYKDVIKNNLEGELGFTLDELKNANNVIIEAIFSFLESYDLESALQNALDLGENVSARAVVAGSIAEAFYGIQDFNKSICNSNITEEMLAVLDKFDQATRRVFLEAVVNENDLFGNKRIEMAAERFNVEQTDENLDRVMHLIYYRMHEGAKLYVPLVVKDRNEEDNYKYLSLQSRDGKFFIAAFTTATEELHERYPNIFMTSIKDFLEEFLQEDRKEVGIILNPDDKKKIFTLSKPFINELLKREPPKNKMFYHEGNINQLSNLDAIVTSEEATLENALFEDDDKLAAAHFMTKSPDNELQYIIHTPLLNYRGSDDKVINSCYWYCLELAKKYHLHVIAFSAEFFKKDSLQASDGRQALGVNWYVTSNTWFKKNSNYGLTAIALTKGSEKLVKGIIRNEQLEKAIELYHKESSDSNKREVMKALYYSMHEGGYFLATAKLDSISDYDSLVYESVEFRGDQYFVIAYTSNEEYNKDTNGDDITIEIKELFEKVASGDEYDGVYLNRYGKTFLLRKDAINKLLSLPKPKNSAEVIIEDVTALDIEAIINFTDDRFNGIDSKIDKELHNLAGAELHKELTKLGHCNFGAARITNGYGTHAKYIIHTAVDENLDNLRTCCLNCLELAKKYHFHSVAIPITCAERSNKESRINTLKKNFVIINKAISEWFENNKDYGMRVVSAVEYEDQKIFIIEIEEEVDKEKSEAYKNLVQNMQEKYPKYELDFSKGAAIRTSEEAKQKARKFAQKFNSKADFWKALKDLGFKWKAENSSDANIKNMWAINALAVAIDRGFNPNDEVYLWAPYVKINGKLSCICNEINLWTYWQGLGYAEKTPKIKYLLVGHDWDNPFVDSITKPNQKLSAEKLIERIKKINNGNIEVPYLDFNYYVYPTDKNLIELFKKLGYDNVNKNDISKQRHDELFFTNFCLGYLTKGKVDTNLMMRDEDLFKELVHILEPENILCLSQDTFMCVYKALTGDEATNLDSRVKGKYNAFLDDHAEIIIRCGNVDIRIYPLAHCGGMGTAMRSLNLQMKDWEKIAEDNK